MTIAYLGAGVVLVVCLIIMNAHRFNRRGD